MVQVGEKRNLMKYFYPAIFTLDRKKNEFRAVFPDLTGCAVKAESMAEAARKAREALGMALMELEEKGIEFPAASACLSLLPGGRGAFGYGCVPRISRVSDGTGGIGFC